MATIKERYEQEKHDFEEVLAGRFFTEDKKSLLTKNEAKFIKDAIPSIDYMLMIMKGDVILPKESENEKSSWGKVLSYLKGSIVNIVMAEHILYGKWSNIANNFYSGYYDFFFSDDDADESDTEFSHDVHSVDVYSDGNESDVDFFGVMDDSAEDDDMDYCSGDCSDSSDCCGDCCDCRDI